MFTVSQLCSALWSMLAFSIVACAATLFPEAAETSQADHAAPAAPVEIAQPVKAPVVQPDELKAKKTSRGMVVFLEEGTLERTINQLVAFLDANPERRVQVEAFSDPKANDVTLELSQRRADTIAMALIDRGIDAQRVRALGWGNDPRLRPNRRVEVIVSNDAGAIPGRMFASAP